MGKIKIRRYWGLLDPTCPDVLQVCWVISDPSYQPLPRLELGRPLALNFLFNVYLFLRDRAGQSMNGRGAEREGDTDSKAGSRLLAVSTEPNVGLKLTNHEIMTWAEGGRLTKFQ